MIYRNLFLLFWCCSIAHLLHAGSRLSLGSRSWVDEATPCSNTWEVPWRPHSRYWNIAWIPHAPFMILSLSLISVFSDNGKIGGKWCWTRRQERQVRSRHYGLRCGRCWGIPHKNGRQGWHKGPVAPYFRIALVSWNFAHAARPRTVAASMSISTGGWNNWALASRGSGRFGEKWKILWMSSLQRCKKS